MTNEHNIEPRELAIARLDWVRHEVSTYFKPHLNPDLYEAVMERIDNKLTYVRNVLEDVPDPSCGTIDEQEKELWQSLLKENKNDK